MSSIIFSQLSRNLKPNGIGFEEEEEEEEQPTSFANEFESPNYEIHLYKNLKNTNNLINVIVHERNMDYVVIKVKKDHEFSFGVKHFSENKVHYTNNIYCEDKYILSYIDSGEIPPLLTDIIDEWWCYNWKKEDLDIKTKLNETKFELWKNNQINHYSNIYYNGCIFAEIRNHRLPSKNPESFLTYFILLKPSRLNHQNEINKIMLSTSHKFKWNNKALLELESSMIYANAPKLYLGLNPNVYSLARKFARRKDILCENQFVRMQRRRLKRSLPLDLSTSRSFSLLNFIRENPCPKLAVSQIPSNNVNNRAFIKSFKFKDIYLLSKKPKVKNRFYEDIVKLEEYIIDQLDSSKCARLVIFHRAVDSTYYGSLLHNKASRCLKPDFYLGNEQSKNYYVEHYIDQFTDMESKPMRITHRIGNGLHNERCTVAQTSLSSRQVRAHIYEQQQKLLKHQRMIMKKQEQINKSRHLLSEKTITALQEKIRVEEEKRQRRTQLLKHWISNYQRQLTAPFDNQHQSDHIVSYMPDDQTVSYISGDNMIAVRQQKMPFDQTAPIAAIPPTLFPDNVNNIHLNNQTTSVMTQMNAPI